MNRVTLTQGGTPGRTVRSFVASLVFVAVSLAVLAASPALAQAPTFTDVNAYGSDQLDLNVALTETGLEPGAAIDYSLDAVADITFTCFSGSHATGKHIVLRNQPALYPVTLQADGSGTVKGTITGYLPELSVPAPSCPGHLEGVSTSVTYSQITLTDATNGVQEAIPGTVTSTDR